MLDCSKTVKKILFCREQQHPKSAEIKMIYNYCDDILQNMIAIKAVAQQQLISGIMTIFRKANELAGAEGYKFPNKLRFIPVIN